MITKYQDGRLRTISSIKCLNFSFILKNYMKQIFFDVWVAWYMTSE